MRWRVVLIQNPSVPPQFWLFPSHLFVQFSHEFNPIEMIHSLATGDPLCHHSTLVAKTTISTSSKFERIFQTFWLLEILVTAIVLTDVLFLGHNKCPKSNHQ
jgi:hypothetical protein